MPGVATPTIEAQEVLDIVQDHGWKVLLFNDDVTPFDVVVAALQRAAKLSEEMAEHVATTAHREGQATVKRGLNEEDARIICGGLTRWTRIKDRCPGVKCAAEPDDQ